MFIVIPVLVIEGPRQRSFVDERGHEPLTPSSIVVMALTVLSGLPLLLRLMPIPRRSWTW